MIYLDTHVALWLYAGELKRIKPSLLNDLQEESLYISPMVKLERQLLNEVGKINHQAKTIVETLSKQIDLRICEKPFHQIIEESLTYDWTRDPFDRLITANAALDQNILITKDRRICKAYKQAKW